MKKNTLFNLQGFNSPPLAAKRMYSSVRNTPPLGAGKFITWLYVQPHTTRFFVGTSKCFVNVALACAFLASANVRAVTGCGLDLSASVANVPNFPVSSRKVSATNSGVILTRHARGLTGQALVTGTSLDQKVVSQNTVAAAINAHMQSYSAAHDADANGTTNINDALILSRYLAGFRGDALTKGLSLSGSRTVAKYIGSYIEGGCVSGSFIPTNPVTANAGLARIIALPDTRLQLNGSAKEAASTTWSQVSGPAQAVFQDINELNTWIMADAVGTYVLRLTAKRSGANSATSDVTITVAANPTIITANSTPLDHLRTLNRPAFKAGHTLLPVSSAYCGEIAEPIMMDLVKHWGYSVYFKYGIETKYPTIAKMARDNPGKYPVEVSFANLDAVWRYPTGKGEYPAWADNNFIRDAAGKVVQPVRVSPTAPDATFIALGRLLGKKAHKVEMTVQQKIALVTNWAENGLENYGDANPAVVFGQDPAVVAAYKASSLDWWQYLSKQKARQEHLIKEAIFAELSNGRPFYSLYGESYGTERGRWFGWKGYNGDWSQYFVNGAPQVSDFSSPEMYYKDFNSGWEGLPGQNIPQDAMTKQLRAIGGLYALGQKFSYPWVSMGYRLNEPGRISELDLYVGSLKTLYMGGAIGGVSGDFNCNAPIHSNGTVGTQAPLQLKGLYALGQVHALFSHLESFVRSSDLLPGPSNHAYGDPALPAMEFQAEGETEFFIGPDPRFPTRGFNYQTARVLARRQANADRWLVSAWVQKGQDRDIKVTIDPKLGKLTLKGRRSGAIYLVELVNGAPVIKLIDTDGMNPTRDMFP